MKHVLSLLFLSALGCANPARFNAQRPEEAMVQIHSSTSTTRGFFVSTDGTIATVIPPAGAVTVTLADGRSFPATLINQNQEVHLALLKIPSQPKGHEFHILHLNDQDAIPGMHVRTITAAGLGHGSFEQWDEFGRIIDFTIPTQPGDAGSPLVADDNRVIGIVLPPIDSHSRAAPAWQALRLMPSLSAQPASDD